MYEPRETFKCFYANDNDDSRWVLTRRRRCWLTNRNIKEMARDAWAAKAVYLFLASLLNLTFAFNVQTFLILRFVWWMIWKQLVAFRACSVEQEGCGEMGFDCGGRRWRWLRGRSVYDPLRDNQVWKWHKKWDQREERCEIRSGENPKLSEEADASQLVELRPWQSVGWRRRGGKQVGWGEGGAGMRMNNVKTVQTHFCIKRDRSCGWFFQRPGSQQRTSAISGHYKKP